VFLKLFFHFSNFIYSTGGCHKRLGPGVIYLLLSISTGLGALIYALINALKKLTHCVSALKKLTPWQLYYLYLVIITAYSSNDSIVFIIVAKFVCLFFLLTR